MQSEPWWIALASHKCVALLLRSIAGPRVLSISQVNILTCDAIVSAAILNSKTCGNTSVEFKAGFREGLRPELLSQVLFEFVQAIY